MRIWFSGPRVGFIRPGVSFGLAGARRVRSRARHVQAAHDGYVYVLEREGDNRVKIGSSRDPDQRRAELQTGSPDILRIAYRVPVFGSAKAAEIRAHDILDRHRGLGEWFAVPVDVAVAAIHAAIYQVGQGSGATRPDGPPRIRLDTYLWGALALCIMAYWIMH